jgi:transposase
LSASRDGASLLERFAAEVFQAYDAGGDSLADLAERFQVSVGWAKKISARRTRSGEVNASTRRRAGRLSRVTVAVREWLREQIRSQPDVTLQELQQRLAQAHQLCLSVGWLWVVVVQQLGLPLKKSHCMRRNKRARKRSGAGKKSGP